MDSGWKTLQLQMTIKNVIGIPVQSHRQIMRTARNSVMAGCPGKSEENKRTRMLSQRENIYGDKLDALE
jgi:hypothetical protein